MVLDKWPMVSHLKVAPAVVVALQSPDMCKFNGLYLFRKVQSCVLRCRNIQAASSKGGEYTDANSHDRLLYCYRCIQS